MSYWILFYFWFEERMLHDYVWIPFGWVMLYWSSRPSIELYWCWKLSLPIFRYRIISKIAFVFKGIFLWTIGFVDIFGKIENSSTLNIVDIFCEWSLNINIDSNLWRLLNRFLIRRDLFARWCLDIWYPLTLICDARDMFKVGHININLNALVMSSFCVYWT